MSLQETIREDGLRLITKYLPHTGKVVVEIVAGLGSAYDPPGQEGLAHFFEHMAFTGTKNRTSDEIAANRGRYFQYSNAATGRLETMYFGEGVYTRLERICDTLFDMYVNPTFPEESIEKERKVIGLEIARNEDNDSNKAYFTLWDMLWRRNPLRQFGAGIPGSLKNITRDLIDSTHKSWYIPSNTLILATGKVNHQELLENINSKIPYNYQEHPQKMNWDDESEDIPLEKRVIIPRPGRQKGIVLMGCKIPVLKNKSTADFDLLKDILGKNSDSLLYQEIRNRRALAYSVGSHLDGDARLGYCLIAIAEVEPKNMEETEHVIREVFCNYPLSREMFERKKESMLDEWLTAFESPWAWRRILKQIILERGKSVNVVNRTLKKHQKIIEQTTFGDIVKAREKFLTPERLVTVIIQPT